MARGGGNELTDAQRRLIEAQTANIPAELRQRFDLAQLEAALKREQIGAERTTEAGKLGLGYGELGQRDRASALAGALNLLDTTSKEGIAGRTLTANMLGDVAAHGALTADQLAGMYANAGQPALYNALQGENVKKREALINQMIPGIKSAKSPAEREKLYKPAFAANPSDYDVAVARAFPDTAGGGGAPLQPTFFKGDVTPSTQETGYGALLGALLSKSGLVDNTPAAAPATTVTRIPPTYSVGVFGGNTPATSGPELYGHSPAYPELPNTPEPRYVPLGEKPLFGSTRVEGGIQTPSGGFIGGEFSDAQLARLTGTPTVPVATEIPQANIPSMLPPALPSVPNTSINPLIGPTPIPSMTPLLANVATPTPVPRPTVTPMPSEMLARLIRQNQY